MVCQDPPPLQWREGGGVRLPAVEPRTLPCNPWCKIPVGAPTKQPIMLERGSLLPPLGSLSTTRRGSPVWCHGGRGAVARGLRELLPAPQTVRLVSVIQGCVGLTSMSDAVHSFSSLWFLRSCSCEERNQEPPASVLVTSPLESPSFGFPLNTSVTPTLVTQRTCPC